ncbi:MAG: DinB family protein [Candidatus Limnocylindria bacterium]
MRDAILADAFGHHVWATDRLIEACLPLTADQLVAPVPGTYGSIIDTMRHLVGADAAYLELLTDGRVAALDPDAEAAMDLATLRRVMAGCGEGWSWLLDQPLDGTRMVVRHRDDGSTSGAPLGVRMAQALHHGTDHRSQVCTALTLLGIEPPAIDVWDFASTDDRLTETQPGA